MNWRINYKSKQTSNIYTKKCNHIAIYRFHDLSKIWLPCKILYQIKKERNSLRTYAILLDKLPQSKIKFYRIYLLKYQKYIYV